MFGKIAITNLRKNCSTFLFVQQLFKCIFPAIYVVDPVNRNFPSISSLMDSGRCNTIFAQHIIIHWKSQIHLSDHLQSRGASFQNTNSTNSKYPYYSQKVTLKLHLNIRVLLRQFWFNRTGMGELCQNICAGNVKSAKRGCWDFSSG